MRIKSNFLNKLTNYLLNLVSDYIHVLPSERLKQLAKQEASKLNNFQVYYQRKKNHRTEILYENRKELINSPDLEHLDLDGHQTNILNETPINFESNKSHKRRSSLPDQFRADLMEIDEQQNDLLIKDEHHLTPKQSIQHEQQINLAKSAPEVGKLMKKSDSEHMFAKLSEKSTIKNGIHNQLKNQFKSCSTTSVYNHLKENKINKPMFKFGKIKYDDKYLYSNSIVSLIYRVFRLILMYMI